MRTIRMMPRWVYDPEMLGKIFENLLEDNKDKGSFLYAKGNSSLHVSGVADGDICKQVSRMPR